MPVFLVLDIFWLWVVARKFYAPRLQHLLSDHINWPVAICFYLIFLTGLLIFAIAPAITAQDGKVALVYGALFGFFTYATYDLTNWSTLRGWPGVISVIDIAWGAALCATAAYAAYRLAMHFVIR